MFHGCCFYVNNYSWYCSDKVRCHTWTESGKNRICFLVCPWIAKFFFCSFGWFSYSIIFEITHGILLLVMWPSKKNRAFCLFLGFLSVSLSLLRRFCLVYFLTGVIGADVSGHGLICEGQPVTSRLAVICGTSSCHMGVSVPQRQGCHLQWRQSRAKYWTIDSFTSSNLSVSPFSIPTLT